MKNTNRPHRIRRRILAIGIPVAALLVGVGIGSSAAGGVPEPRVETKIETREVPVEVEKEVEVPVTPAACLAALDDAETVTMLSIEAFGIVAEMFDAVSAFNVAGIDRGTANLDALQPEVAAAIAAYNEEAEECRAY